MKTCLSYISKYNRLTRAVALRWLALITVLVLTSVDVYAQLLRDDEGNYIIATKEDYMQLVNNSTYWDECRSFIQIFDIDFGGVEIKPIGNLDNPFTGTYDGRGHSLKNAVIYWNSVPEFTYALFGYVYGDPTSETYATIKNLNIENIRVTRTPDMADEKMWDTSEVDLKLGILAAQLGEYVQIHDISIQNCIITDNGQKAVVKSIMAGGLAGDMYKNKTQSTTAMSAQETLIKNVFVRAAINLQNVEKAASYLTSANADKANDDPQYFVGGIMGRIRYATAINHLPDNTVYSGTIIAPRGSVSPTVSNMRGTSGNAYSTLVKTYAGELTSALLKDGLGTEVYNAFNQRHLYYDYSAYNSSNATIESITDTYPPVTPTDGKYAYGTRTFAPNANAKGTVYTTGWSVGSETNWGRVQGVNFGTFSDPVSVADDRAQILSLLSDARIEPDKCHWEWDAALNTYRLVTDNEKDLLKAYIENDVDNNLYIAKIAYKVIGVAYPGAADGTIQWYSATSVQDNDWTAIKDATDFTIPANKTLFYRFEWTYDGQTITSDYIAPTRRIYVYNPESNDKYNQDFEVGVYKFNENHDPEYALAGRDINDGLTPKTAVLTMARAFELLDEYGDVKTNTIVTMGYYTDDDYLYEYDPEIRLYAKPATITGTDNDKIFNGILGLDKLNKSPRKSGYSAHYLFFQAPLRFDNITILDQWHPYGQKPSCNSHAVDGAFFICNYFDLTVDENVRFVNFRPVSNTYGLAGNITSMPYLTVVGGTEDHNQDATVSPIQYANERYPNHPGFYTTPDATTINIRSGVFGRIICCGRNDELNPVSRNITGTPDKPNRIRLNVNIKNDIDVKDPNRQNSSYGDTLTWVNGKLRYVSARYSHNIGLISGGQTDGSAYGDVVINVYAGHIARIITSNITFGRNTDYTANGVTKAYPSDSFWGRSILNIYGNTEMDADGVVTSETTINEVFGGMLGRISSAASTIVCRPYFYGKSVINMYGGYIGKYTGTRTDCNLSNLRSTIPNLYGVGSGGVTGLGYDEHHTSDFAIPFINDEGILDYGEYDLAKDRMPPMTMLDGEQIDLKVAKCEVNLYSGIILGSVYGGGYGYSSSLYQYDKKNVYQKAPGDLGVLYGDSKVTMHRHPDFQPPLVLGNIYGSGAGSSFYAEHFETDYPEETNKFLGVAAQYGNTEVVISDGTVGDAKNSTGGDVYAGSQGVEGYQNIAALYGSTNLVVNGGTIYGNIYGGSEIANINAHDAIPNSGNTHVTINGGIIGNNIFGGSKGIDGDAFTPKKTDAKATIHGDTYVTINGGDFIGNPYIDLNQQITYDADGNPNINIWENRDKFRTFNIYGGGYMNCDIKGAANLNVRSSLLCNEGSIVNSRLNPNSIPDPNISGETEFHKAYMDITYRCFCVYGGGFGEKTNVLRTNVYVTIPSDRQHVQLPHGFTLDRFLDHQSFFDIAGGGYSGDVGYWATGTPSVEYGIASGTPVKNIDIDNFKTLVRAAHPGYSDIEVHNEVVRLYDHYVGGECKVTIDDYTFARKVIGGGFYGSCRTTDTHVRCGSLRQVYGGSLLGYVHDRAYLQFGNRLEDFVRWNPALNEGAGGYVYSEHEEYDPFKGDIENVEDNYPEVYALASSFAKELNDYIFITENIYGGNDVKGIIGTKRWEAPESTPANPIYGVDETDRGPLFCTDVDPSEEKGIVFNIYGGTFMGDIYSAGNGHYRGYYVPEWVRYDDGPARMYRSVTSSIDPNKKGRAYRSRPMVGSVNVNLRGNSPDDMINVHGNFFGGGRECTIGQFNTILPLEDPRRLVVGGHLHVNFGGFVQVDGNVYMGAEGRMLSQQLCLPSAIDLTGKSGKKFNGSTTKELERLGDIAYSHWYYDKDAKSYLPGFPASGKVDGNFGMTGEHMLSSYMQNVQVQGDVELTFYRFLYERNADRTFKYETFSDGSQNRVRKRWVPGEMAVNDYTDMPEDLSYDATNVVMNSFFLGGLSGSMTNNNVMGYCYTKGVSIDPDIDKNSSHDHETWGSIYRIVLPKGVTIHDKVVMGSENATISIYPYNEDYTDIVTTTDDGNGNKTPITPTYTYEGGIITQHTFSYDLIVYNDLYSPLDKYEHYVPADFYTNSKYSDILASDHHTLTKGDDKGKVIYRMNYSEDHFPARYYEIQKPRYSLAKLADGVAYIGPRDYRAISGHLATVCKLTAVCNFDQVSANPNDPSDHDFHYGGNIYGGCYNSGVVIGDVVMNLGTNLLGSHLDENSSEVYDRYSSLRYNIGRVFGGGFGRNTCTYGDTYVNLLRNFKGMNVFGGGMEGNVTGTAHVTYIGTEDNSYVFGAIYGGGLQGFVGTPGETVKATEVRLFSGNVKRVYGGSCMGDLNGRAFVELCDQVTDVLDHLDYKRFNFDDWGGSRLIVGKVFGGNDIAGNITPLQGSPFAAPTSGSSASTEWQELTEDEVLEQFWDFTTGVYVHEVKEKSHTSAPSEAPVYPSKTSPGSNNGYNGFPLIGDLYGGSNGNYGVQGPETYISGTVTLASGNGIDVKVVDIAGMDVPHIDKSHILIRGGSVINAYGGGDMCDIRSAESTAVDKITVDYPTDEESKKARAGFDTYDELTRVWTVLNFSSDQQKDEVTENIEDDLGVMHPIFKYNICRLFGGNNNADMGIQPTWRLKSANIGSLYSGGNFGKMTFYQQYQPAKPAVEEDLTANPPVEAQEATAEVPECGLTLTVDSYDLTINNVYGGGRVGDIAPAIPAGEPHSDDFYGATLNINKGIIEHVYGGNDVSGYVSYGTNVNLRGAISGDVYCAGNGNYLYKYDREGLLDYSVPENVRINEDFAFRTEEYTGARYFYLPAKADYGFDIDNPTSYRATDAQTIMAINSYRPNVERAKILIEGTADNKVWVKGNVYCGGNSATVTRRNETSPYDVIFKIGSNVILNGVFLGSNGESLSYGDMIMNIEKLNATSAGVELDMTGDNNLTTSQLKNTNDLSAVTYKSTLYPSLLDLYMRAVEVTEKPNNFDFNPNISEAYIGEFCVGGNRGSMMTNQKISLTFPESLTIFNHIIGGCKDANVTYNGVTHIGGLTMPLAGDEKTKIDMVIKSRFRPLNLIFPDVDATPPISIKNTIVDADGKPWTSGDKYYTNQQCNVFGGCFTSGTTIGGVNIDLYSDMLNYECNDAQKLSDPTDPTSALVDNTEYIDKQAVINGIKDIRSWRSFTVVGGGYGASTAVLGDISVRMLPGTVTTTSGGTTTTTVTHPSVASIFGGSQEGLVVGNTNVEIRDGKVLANVYGASEAAKMYGSTSVIVGYPRYYRVKKTGNYRINRVDYMSKVSRYDLKDGFDEVVVPKTVAYCAGELMPNNVYEMLLGRVQDSRIITVIDNTDFRVGKNVDDSYVDPITEANISTYVEPVLSSVDDGHGGKIDHIVPQDFGVNWSDITIWIGDQSSNIDPDGPYYGQGNIYGGGYVPNTSDRTLVGQPTVMRFTKDYNRGYLAEYASQTKEMQDKLLALYGGNTAVMIWDNEENAEIDPDTKEYKYSESQIFDHVHIGTGYFAEKELPAGSSVKGYFEKVVKEVPIDETDPSKGSTNIPAYVYQTYGKAESGKTYYEKKADGGVYGGGRKVFAEAFRSIDLAYYGYGEHTPQNPKLLNTIQRADVATITDCCMELVGASDFTVNDYKGVYYAINRVGELRMYSSLDPEQSLDDGYIDETDGIRIHAKKRSRNYIALYNKTNHLGAYRSNWSFEKKYHGPDGVTSTKVETDDYGYPYGGTGGKGIESYVNHKHRYIDFFKGYAALRNKVEKEESITMAEVLAVKDTYENFTGETFTYTSTDPIDYFKALAIKMEDVFKERNVGTSGNMMGINSGYELSFEGLACQRGENYETKYYGPAYGVTEMKILTTVSGMGGGYVYALNHHYDPDIDGTQLGTETPSWCAKWGQDFLQTSGNFVFPGAAYQTVNNNTLQKNYNFIIDDCFDYFDIDHGYYNCDNHARDIIRSRAYEDPEPGINEPHEVHYWYVSGNTYVFNVTVTAFTSDKDRQFWLSNDNDRINLFNVKKDTEITVSQVNWFTHEDLPAGACDLSNMDKKYKMYLTLGNDTQNEYTETEKAEGTYVIRIPRFTYEAAEDAENNNMIVNVAESGNIPDNFDGEDNSVIVDPNYYLNAEVNTNKFGYKMDGVTPVDGEIKPRLGIRLVDNEANRLAHLSAEESQAYFENHLKPDHMIQVILDTKSPGKDPITFIINIDVRYLMGPAIYGNINIENCALPGEYIYANAKDVRVEMDPDLGIPSQKWCLYPNDDKGYRVAEEGFPIDKDGHRLLSDTHERPESTASDYNTIYKPVSYDLCYTGSEYTVEDDERLIHIPAYYYQNGWEVAYQVTANDENFESSLPYYKKVEDPNTGEMVDDFTQPIPENRLQIHNYHRMKPIYKGNVFDLRLVKGARIYIENEEDMHYFFDYLEKMQAATPDALYKRFTIPDGRTVNPQFCQDLDFYQQTTLPVPTDRTYTNLHFAGSYHGNGNWMSIPDGANIYMINDGFMYNTGFVSEVANDRTIIYNENQNGTIMNCFYFNKQGKGALAKNGKLYNCYQNTDLIVNGDPVKDPENTAEEFEYNQLMKLSTLGFRYGHAAYNLNGFYLQKRHLLLHDGGADNNDYALHAKDTELRAMKGDVDPVTGVDPYDKYAVKYIEDMFNNGDYRYAFYHQTINGVDYPYTQFTEALRTADIPNYFDYKGNRNNSLPVSMHDYSHKVDEARWCDNHNEYHPIFDTDYMFFGEDVSVNVDEHNDNLPEAFSPANRVYRVGGYYGSAADKGYFMNRKAFLDTPLMTAIDFVGYRDRDMYEVIPGTGKSYGPNGAHGALKASVRTALGANGWLIIPGQHEVFMPPTLDLPWLWTETSTADPNDPTATVTTVDLKHDFSSFDVNSDKVTHNLLIYTENIPEALSVMDDFHYTPTMTYGRTEEYSFATHPDSEIRAHHIIDDYSDDAGPVMYGDYFHLVDKHDFNAPVAFKAKQAWYNRQPQDYSDEYTIDNGSGVTEVFKTAWEGICLPFNVRKVYAATTDKTAFRQDMGELTHFFGDDWKGHEYWLRRFTKAEADGSKMNFARPTVENKGGTADDSDKRDLVADYTYSNTAIYDLYKDFNYDEPNVPDEIVGTDTIRYTHDQLYHFDKNAVQKSRVIKDYRYLSRSVPYIVTYPGKYFYEFDLSGKFYADQYYKYNNAKTTVVPQTICYLANNTDSYIEIPVTDAAPLVSYSDGGYTMKGTFMHVTDNDALSQSVLYEKVNNLAVLDAVDLSGNEVHHGTEFKAHSGNMVVEPFRTYVVKNTAFHSPVLIGSRDCIGTESIIVEDEPQDDPEVADEVDEHIKVWVEGKKLVIETPCELDTNIYNTVGQTVKRIKAYEGINRYSGLPSGFYIVLRTKVYIP